MPTSDKVCQQVIEYMIQFQGNYNKHSCFILEDQKQKQTEEQTTVCYINVNHFTTSQLLEKVLLTTLYF